MMCVVVESKVLKTTFLVFKVAILSETFRVGLPVTKIVKLVINKPDICLNNISFSSSSDVGC